MASTRISVFPSLSIQHVFQSAWQHTCLISALGDRGRQIEVSSRSTGAILKQTNKPLITQTNKQKNPAIMSSCIFFWKFWWVYVLDLNLRSIFESYFDHSVRLWLMVFCCCCYFGFGCYCFALTTPWGEGPGAEERERGSLSISCLC